MVFLGILSLDVARWNEQILGTQGNYLPFFLLFYLSSVVVWKVGKGIYGVHSAALC